jgi:hypothetical protein
VIEISEEPVMFLSNKKRLCVPIELIPAAEKEMNTFEPVKMAGSIAYDRSMPSQID